MLRLLLLSLQLPQLLLRLLRLQVSLLLHRQRRRLLNLHSWLRLRLVLWLLPLLLKLPSLLRLLLFPYSIGLWHAPRGYDADLGGARGLINDGVSPFLVLRNDSSSRPCADALKDRYAPSN